MTLEHYKTIVLEKIVHDSDPNDRHVKQWTSQHIQIKRLLRDMQREGLLKIEYINHKGCIKRTLIPIE